MFRNKGFLSPSGLADAAFALLLGLVFMELVVGLDKINPTFTSWILIRGSDIAYHYLSWEYFKDSPWGWPAGRLEGYAYPMYNSILYTDSIPLLAFLFKSLRIFLPNDFQYFGLWYALCFVLNSFFGLVLLKHIGWGRIVRCMLAPFFTGAVVLIARFGHAALCGQWLILYTLLIYLKRNEWQSRKVLLHAYAVVLLASLIHPYLLFMVLGLTTTTFIQWSREQKLTLWNFLKHILGILMLSLGGWYTSGAFLFKGQLSEGLGRFSANFNTFINAWDVGRIGPRFPYYGDGQGEGIAYLGFGILFLILILSGIYLVRWIKEKYTAGIKMVQAYNPYFLICLLFFLFALSPRWTWGNQLIIDWGYNDYISRTFRGTGRFAWPLFYYILYEVCRWLYTIKANAGIKYLLAGSALVLQAVDLSPLWKRKPYVDDPPFRMAYVDQIQHLISRSDKVIIYPPYISSIADFGDYIYFTDLAQREKKPISTGYGARFPEAIGKAFRDSLKDLPSYLKRNPQSLLITYVDSVDLHQQLIDEVHGVSFQFDRYRLFIPDTLKNRIEVERFDPRSSEAIKISRQFSLKEFLELYKDQTVLGAVYEEGISNLGPSTRDYLKQMGLTTDSLRFGSSWAFIVRGNKSVKESYSMHQVSEVFDTLRCGDQTTPVSASSGGYQAGKLVSIRRNGVELIEPDRGLSLVVMDSCGVVLDKVRYDTYLTDGFLFRR